MPGQLRLSHSCGLITLLRRHRFPYCYILKFEFSLHGIRLEWDSNKSEANLRKHGIAFENACEEFFDPFLRMMEPEIHNGQIREAIVGMAMNWRLLYVKYHTGMGK